MITQGLLFPLLLAAPLLAVFPASARASEYSQQAHLSDLVPFHRRPPIKESFSSLNTETWKCEGSCPTIEGGKARFTLHSKVEPDEEESWSKLVYSPRRFTSGRFTVSFSMTARPPQEVWWGVALWDDGTAPDGSRFNEINFGYVTDQSFKDTQLLFESARHGQVESVKVDTGVDLYDESYHNATLEYNDRWVAFYLDGELLKTITNKTVIPTDPMDLILGPRLVTGSKPLRTGFTQSINWVQITNWRS